MNTNENANKPINTEIEQRPALLKDILAVARGDNEQDLMQARMRQAIMEIIGVTPQRFHKRIQDYVDTGIISIFRRARRYTTGRIVKKSVGLADKKSIEETENAFNDMRISLLNKLHQQSTVIQNFIINNTYSMDLTLYSQGYFRGPHNLGVDYSDIKFASELPARIEQAEQKLHKEVEDIQILEAENRQAEQSIQKLLRLESWLDSVVTDDLEGDIAELMRLRGILATLQIE